MIEESMIREKFIKGYDCSQVVLSYFAERLGITEKRWRIKSRLVLEVE